MRGCLGSQIGTGMTETAWLTSSGQTVADMYGLQSSVRRGKQFLTARHGKAKQAELFVATPFEVATDP